MSVAAAKSSFLAGDHDAYISGIIEVLIGALPVFVVFPNRDRAREVQMQYRQKDMTAIGSTKLQAITTRAQTGGK
jgi:MFS transporter, DHA2 family, multidrug resistance protein